MSAINSRHFREAVGKYATGVAVVTTLDATGKPAAMTVNSFASVSLDPPLVLWSVDKYSRLFEAFSNTPYFAVHILRHDQQYLAKRFSDDRDNVCAGMTFSEGENGLPILDDVSVSLQCNVVNRHEEGDHIILIGRVIHIAGTDIDPLLFFAGEYRRLER